MEGVLVSVWCVAYNHELYIRDAIEGFLKQKTNFRYEVIIHDDASTDNTAKIIKEYEKKYPDLIYGIYQEDNQYKKNWPSTQWLQEIQTKKCKGKYIAVCEGDDCWIDVQKLQIQVDYLEQHPECVMTVHDAVYVDYRNYNIKSGSKYGEDCIVPAEDIITQRVYMVTASMVYRREISEMSGFFTEVGVDDYPSLLYCLMNGTIYYFSRIMSIYRQFHQGSWTFSMTEDKKASCMHNVMMINFLNKYNRYSDNKFRTYVISRIQKSVENILDSCIGIDREDFFETSKKYNLKDKSEYDSIYKQLEKLRRQKFDENYMDEDVWKFIKKYQNIVIMGAGYYAGILAKQFERYGVLFKGFVVSDDQEIIEKYLNKPVWKLKDLPFNLKDTGIVIGINPKIWGEIESSLNRAKAEHFICPFLYKV